MINRSLVSVETAADLIKSGALLGIAGPESALDQLPAGRWIGGTSSYFMTEDGGVKSRDLILVTALPDEGPVRFAAYDAKGLAQLMKDAPENGFTYAVVPSGSPTLQKFAEGSRFWPEIFLKPVVGWVAGIDLAQLGQTQAMVYNGCDGTKHNNAMVVAHVSLPPGRVATLETINIFERDPLNVIRFSRTTSEVVDCVVNGHGAKLADFLKQNGNAEGKLPLIGDFAGASINVAVQSVDQATGLVKFFAPVFADVEYTLAKPVADYAARFAAELASYNHLDVAFSCNCILNYLYGGLEGKKTGNLTGPVTFGEIAYLLHNQTMVILRIN